jgi:hypothetical protein
MSPKLPDIYFGPVEQDDLDELPDDGEEDEPEGGDADIPASQEFIDLLGFDPDALADKD